MGFNSAFKGLNITLLPVTVKATNNDKADAHLPDTINSAINKSTPLRAWNFMSTQIATSTRHLIREQNKLCILWQRTHNIALRPCINALKKETDRAIKTQLCNNWHQTVQNPASSNMQDMRRTTNPLTNNTTNTPPLKRKWKPCNHWAREGKLIRWYAAGNFYNKCWRKFHIF